MHDIAGGLDHFVILPTVMVSVQSLDIMTVMVLVIHRMMMNHNTVFILSVGSRRILRLLTVRNSFVEVAAVTVVRVSRLVVAVGGYVRVRVIGVGVVGALAMCVVLDGLVLFVVAVVGAILMVRPAQVRVPAVHQSLIEVVMADGRLAVYALKSSLVA